MSNKYEMNYDLTIRIKSIRTNEIISLTLKHKHNTVDRFIHMDDVLNAAVPGLFFGGENELYLPSDPTTTNPWGDEHVANLISDGDVLSCWLQNDCEYLDDFDNTQESANAQ